MPIAVNARQAEEALKSGNAVSNGIADLDSNGKPISAEFKFHIIVTEDAKTKNLKQFRVASAVTTQKTYGSEKQDYTPEMLAWDRMLVDNNNGRPEMAQLCGFDLDEYEKELQNAAIHSEWSCGNLKAFKYHIHFVQDPKVGQKKFYVASITALPRTYGTDNDQHYTPEMLRWDDMQKANGQITNPNDTLANRCGTSLEEINGMAAEAQERTEEALFKAHTVEVLDPAKNVTKKFYVSSMTSTAAHYGKDDQHYTPEMYHWDCLRRDNNNFRDNNGTMADMCGEKFESYK